MSKHIVKIKGHTEEYDSRKVYASIYCAAMSVREPHGSAELIAEEVTNDVDKWITNKNQVTSADIRRQATKRLSEINPDAGHMYKLHREHHK